MFWERPRLVIYVRKNCGEEASFGKFMMMRIRSMKNCFDSDGQCDSSSATSFAGSQCRMAKEGLMMQARPRMSSLQLLFADKRN